MCKVNNQWCDYLIRYDSNKKNYKMFCITHRSFEGGEIIPRATVERLKITNPELISKDCGNPIKTSSYIKNQERTY